jgi:hypothetical protein
METIRRNLMLQASSILTPDSPRQPLALTQSRTGTKGITTRRSAIDRRGHLATIRRPKAYIHHIALYIPAPSPPATHVAESPLVSSPFRACLTNRQVSQWHPGMNRRLPVGFRLACRCLGSHLPSFLPMQFPFLLRRFPYSQG